MGNEQTNNNNQFDQYQGYGNKKKISHSNKYSGHQFSYNDDNSYKYSQNAAYQSNNNHSAWYQNEAEHPNIVMGNDNAEKILYAQDRRHQVTAYYDGREIIKCIGYIDCSKSGGGQGTATVFKVTAGFAYAITANQVVSKKGGSCTFTRDAKQGKVQYQSVVVKVNANCNIAVIKFQDKGGFYANILSGNTVHLMDCDTIDYMEQLYYGLYGYPDPGKKSRAKRGELWGMEGLANGEAIKIKGHDRDLYIRRTANDELVYNRFDTEAGQIGAAVYIELSDHEFGIIGIHTGENNKENCGVALTPSRIKWINT